MMKHNFRKLEIWKRSRKLVKEVYLLTKKFPKEELYGLTSQLRRATVSIPSNIAEGVSRSTNSQIAHFLDISISSSCESETQLYLAFDLEYISDSDLNPIVDEISQIRRMMMSFQSKHQ
ncbi:MAG: four helix bundle protein [Saprospiraceae bacterium]